MPQTVGDNFGLNDNYDYHEIEFDSMDTQNTLAARVSDSLINEKNLLNWPLFTIGRPLSNVIALKIVSAEIPFSYYVVTNFNGYFQLIEDNFASTHFLQIPAGNYTSGTLAAEFQSLLNSQTIYTASVTPGVYTVEFDNSTGKFIVKQSTTVAADFKIEFGTGSTNPGYDNPRLVLGFRGGLNFGAPYFGGPGLFGQILFAPFTAQITGPNYLYINSNLQGQQVGLYLPDGSFSKGQLGPQMAKVPINANPGEVIFYEDPDPQKWFDVEGINAFYQIDFYCTLGNNPEKMDFQGLSFSIKLGILTVKTAHTEQKSGLISEGRVVKRMYGSA